MCFVRWEEDVRATKLKRGKSLHQSMGNGLSLGPHFVSIFSFRFPPFLFCFFVSMNFALSMNWVGRAFRLPLASLAYGWRAWELNESFTEHLGAILAQESDPGQRWRRVVVGCVDVTAEYSLNILSRFSQSSSLYTLISSKISSRVDRTSYTIHI